MGERRRHSHPGISCYAQCLRSSWVFRATERLLAVYTYSTIPWHDLTWTALNCSLSNWLFREIFLFFICYTDFRSFSVSSEQPPDRNHYQFTGWLITPSINKFWKLELYLAQLPNGICKKLHVNQNNFDTRKWVNRLFHLNGNGLEYKWECKCRAM